MGVYSIAITSGKGGVGKSLVAANLAVALGRAGRRVLLLDADLGLGDVAALLGIDAAHTVEAVLRGECAVADALVEGPEGIWIIGASTEGDTGFWQHARVSPAAVGALTELETVLDYIIVDTGAGVDDRVLDFATAADTGYLVVTPEPTAVADAYATLKVLLGRTMRGTAGLVVNMADNHEEAVELQTKFAELVHRFLGAQIDNCGYIPLDRYVRESVKHQFPLVLSVPPSPAAEALAQIAGVVLQQSRSHVEAPEGFFSRLLACKATINRSP